MNYLRSYNGSPLVAVAAGAYALIAARGSS